VSLHIGTLAWVDKTGGCLTTGDELRLVGQLVPTALAEGLRRIGKGVTGSEPESEYDVADLAIPIPCTGVAAWAEAICAAVSEPWLLAHCHRTYLIGAALGCRAAIDRELFYTAAMLHDVGLHQPFGPGSFEDRTDSRNSWASSPCFAVRGADVAATLADAGGWSSSRARKLAEAVSLHINVRVPRSRGMEAHLLNASSALDVLRLGVDRIPKSYLAAIEERWPRGDEFCPGLLRAWRDVSSKDTRAAFLGRCGFEWQLVRVCKRQDSSSVRGRGVRTPL
jgi:hypothetical protein